MSQHHPRKRFGQNFLQDRNVVGRIVRAIAPVPGQHLVEIGPGKGALTEQLLPVVGVLDVVEIDRDLIPLLVQHCAGMGQLTVHEADALKFDFSTLVKTDEKLRIVGNLPYNISTPLLFHLLDFIDVIDDMYFMLQKEVVERMVADHGSKTYGRLSVMLQYHFQIAKLFDVGPGAFFPAPAVDSSIVRLRPLKNREILATDYRLFSTLVNHCFCHRRKVLRNTLKEWLNEEDILAIGIEPTARPETLTVAQFVRLSNRAAEIKRQNE